MPDNKPDKADKAESLLQKAFDVLFIRNPTKTGLGVLLGLILYTISENIIRFTGIALILPVYFWVALSILVLNFRNLFTHHAIDEKLETEMHYIDEVQKKAGFSEREKRQQWRDYISLVFNQTSETINSHNEDKDRTVTK